MKITRLTVLMIMIGLLAGCGGDEKDTSDHLLKEHKQAIDKAKDVQKLAEDMNRKKQDAAEEK